MEDGLVVEKVRKTTLAVPAAFRNELVRKRNLNWIAVLSVAAAMIGFHFFQSHPRNISGLLQGLIALPMGLLLWCIELKSSWKYVLEENDFLDKHMITGIGFSFRQAIWSWRTIVLSSDNTVEVSEVRWRNLPALCIRKRAKCEWQEYSIYLVYTDAEEETVKSHILPLIEKHRKHTTLWADRLRS